MNRVIVFIGALLLVSAPAWAAGRPCPEIHGACFEVLAEGRGFLLDDLEDGEAVAFWVDGLNDFLREDPTDEVFIHLAGDASIFYCPFVPLEPPWDLCVDGRGHVKVTGRLGGPPGLCPGQLRLVGTGNRVADNAPFTLSARFLVTKNGGECVVRKHSINAHEVE